MYMLHVYACLYEFNAVLICAFTRLRRVVKASRLNARIAAKYLLPSVLLCVGVCVAFTKLLGT